MPRILSVAEFAPMDEEEQIGSILKRADSTFAPVWLAEDELPKAFRASNGFTVDFVTKYQRGKQSPVLIRSLGISAVALGFQEFPVEETMETVALYGSGVLVRVPTPLNFALYKLIVAQQRRQAQTAKKQKDLRQAEELIDILLETDEAVLLDALDDARDRGKAWKSAINASLREIGRDARQGQLPMPIPSRKQVR